MAQVVLSFGLEVINHMALFIFYRGGKFRELILGLNFLSDLCGGRLRETWFIRSDAPVDFFMIV